MNGRTLWRPRHLILALFFIAAGILHFVRPGVYLKIVPPYLPYPLALVYVSGFFEILGGAGLLVPPLRRAAGWGLIALLVAVFPANVQMAVAALGGESFSVLAWLPARAAVWVAVLRLPLQLLLIGWVYWGTLDCRLMIVDCRLQSTIINHQSKIENGVVPMLKAADLEKRYGGTRALDKVSFRVEQGEMFGLLGPNGAGKTTLLSIVCGLLPATAGTVKLLGRPLLSEAGDLRRAIGVVPQELAVYGELTARENLTFFGELYGLRGPVLARRVGEVLEAIGLADRADTLVRTFSGGMKRRLNLGAGLVHGPKLLLLDEPTVGVDPQSRNHIFEEVRRLNAAGVTVVYTTHYMEEVQALCTRIGIMDHGRLIRCDTLPNLLSLLESEVRVRVDRVTPALLERLTALPDVRLTVQADRRLLLHCRAVKDTLVRLVGVLNELQVELTGLEIQEPNLERVFLHLTDKALRD